MSLVLLVGGKLTSGKDAFADHLVDKHNFKKLGMSDTLAEALYLLDPLIPLYSTDDWAELGEKPEGGWDVLRRYSYIVDKVGYVRAKKISEVRRLLQALGTEVGRNMLGENIWVQAAKKKILELVSAGHNVVITGIRFPNEIALEEQLNDEHDDVYAAVSVWVERPGLPVTATHASEASVSLQDFQYVLDNAGTLEELYKAAEALLDTIENDYSPDGNYRAAVMAQG